MSPSFLNSLFCEVSCLQKMSRKKKGKTSKRSSQDDSEEVNKSKKPQHALLYLRNWSNKSSGWKFRKQLQVFLQKHGLKTITDEEDFQTFCQYMKGSPQGTRVQLVKDAKKIVDDESQDESLQNRAKQLLQSLDDQL